MFGTFLVTTSTEGLRPLGTAPQRSYELITGTMRYADGLGEAHANLFAEPVATEHGDRLDWYSSIEGRARALASCDVGLQGEITVKLEALKADIRAYAGRLTGSKDAEEQRLGEALVNALETPGEASIYVQEGEDGPQPVLVNWAWVEDRQQVVRVDLKGTDTKATAAVAAAQAAAARKAEADAAEATRLAEERAAAPAVSPAAWFWLYWLGWLILALMIAAILYLMIAPCALRLPGLTNYCPVAERDVQTTAHENRVLRDRIAIVERQIGVADRACQPQPRQRTDLQETIRRLARAGERPERQSVLAPLPPIVSVGRQDTGERMPGVGD